MKKCSNLLVILLTAFSLLFSGSILAKKPYLTSVNNTCGTSYDCGLCHVDSGGGGPLTPDGEAFQASGYDPTIYCPGSSCMDGDGDGFGNPGDPSCPEGGATDCVDSDASINPGAAEICDDGDDNDCDNKTDCDDNECSGEPLCQSSGGPEICDDGIDNDGDGKADCSDKRDCKNDPFCAGSGGNPGGDPEICNDGVDNDGDGKIDCADKKDCRTDPVCQ